MPGREAKKTKVAILGGGVSAVAAAFDLTSPKNPAHDRYEVTLYQMGWRLGGKGASGRNARCSQRIEEHGLHIWMGWYHNAFRLIRECYAELDRPPTSPLATWDEAFKPHDRVTPMDFHDGRWKRWDISFPRTREVPGGRYPSLWAQLQMAYAWIVTATGTRNPMGWRFRSRGAAGEGDRRFLRAVFGSASLIGLLKAGLPGLIGFLRSLSIDRPVPAARCRKIRSRAAEFGRRVRAAIDSGEFDPSDRHRRAAQILDLVFATVVGLIDEGVATGERTYSDLDELELREFLRTYGCHSISLECAFLRSYYNIALAYRTGDSTDPANDNTGAGTAINITLRGCIGYRGAFMWQMQAGMGDAVFAPYYEVLKRRGVKFKFFHRVRHLELSRDGRRIERIHIARQVDVRGEEYDPLIDVKRLPCWPSEPLYDQIVQGAALADGHGGRPYNLESPFSGWKDVGRVTLEAGSDFDRVILGIPVGAHHLICQELMDHDPRWKEMVDRIETVPTQAFQLWFRPSAEDLGWDPPVGEPSGTRTVVGAYELPFHTWADLSHLIAVEDWPRDETPRSVGYFCGTFPVELIEESGADDARRLSHAVERAVRAWMEAHAGTLWPRLARSNGGGPDWEQLADLRGRTGGERLGAQYLRLNLDPSERYVQTIAGTTKYRLRAGESGFDNLVLTGDWIDTGICGGSVEVASMSGAQASRAISGYPARAFGEAMRSRHRPASGSGAAVRPDGAVRDATERRAGRAPAGV